MWEWEKGGGVGKKVHKCKQEKSSNIKTWKAHSAAPLPCFCCNEENCGGELGHSCCIYKNVFLGGPGRERLKESSTRRALRVDMEAPEGSRSCPKHHCKAWADHRSQGSCLGGLRLPSGDGGCHRDTGDSGNTGTSTRASRCPALGMGRLQPDPGSLPPLPPAQLQIPVHTGLVELSIFYFYIYVFFVCSLFH